MTDISLSAREWKYFADGGAHWVYQYLGSDRNYCGKVLRIPKSIKETKDCNFGKKCKVSHYLICRLFKGKYIEKQVELIGIKKSRVLELLGHQFRNDLGLEEITTVQLMPDYSNGPIEIAGNFIEKFTVEIKPKWGYLPLRYSNLNVDSAGRSLNISKCRYCMHQFLKFQKKEIENVNHKFCPLSLYSSEPKRVRTAIESIADNPQNNFRLFHCGEKVSIKSNDDWDSFEKKLRLPDTNHKNFKLRICRILEILFHQEKELFRVLKYHQSRMDIISPAEARSILAELSNDQNVIDVEEILSKTNFWQSLLEKYEFWSDEYGSEIFEKLELLGLFLLSCTLKDLSIMMMFAISDFNSDYTAGTSFFYYDGQVIRYEIKLIDYDIKPLEKVYTYHEHEYNIIQSFIQHLILESPLENINSCLE